MGPANKASYARYGVQGNRFRTGAGSGVAQALGSSIAGARSPSLFSAPHLPSDYLFGTEQPTPSGSTTYQPVDAKPLPGPAPGGGAGGGAGGGGAGGAQGGGQPPNAYGLDYTGDPILQQIRALNIANVQAAHAGELSKRKQAFIGFGHQAGTDTSAYPDAGTVAAAEQNPFSTLAQLLHNHEQRAKGLDESLNAGNLYYSSTRGQRLGEEGRQYLGEEATANNQLASLLSGYANETLGAEQNAAQSNMAADQGAYDRALQFAMQYGVGPGGGGLGGPGGYPNTVNQGGGVSASDPSQLDTSGGWGVQWSGPGVYTAVKQPPTTPGGHSNTVWVKSGELPGDTGAPGAGGGYGLGDPGALAPPPPATQQDSLAALLARNQILGRGARLG